MNKNFVSKFMALVILGYCCSIANATDNDNNYDSKSMDSTEGQTSVSGSVLSVNNMDSDTIVKYEPDKMWFDYQALFDKTKSVVLGQNVDIEVKHVDFDDNILARDTLFKDFKNYGNSLSNILNGDITIQYEVIYHCASYAKKLFALGFSTLYPEEHCRFVPLNFKYLVSVVASLGKKYDDIAKQYLQYTNGVTPDFIRSKDIMPESLHEVISYIEL